MYYVFERNNSRNYGYFETKSAFNQGYQSAWGRIVGEEVSLRDALIMCGASIEVVDSLTGPRNYLVVYEFTALTGGKFKNRFIENYHSRFEVKHLVENKNLTVIAEGVSEEEARLAVAYVPPICIYLNAIEDAFKEDTSNIPNRLETNLVLASTIVDSNRAILWNNAQVPPYPDEVFMEYFRKIKWEESAKAMVITSLAILYSFTDNDLNKTVSNDQTLVTALVQSYLMGIKIYPIA